MFDADISLQSQWSPPCRALQPQQHIWTQSFTFDTIFEQVAAVMPLRKPWSSLSKSGRRTGCWCTITLKTGPSKTYPTIFSWTLKVSCGRTSDSISLSKGLATGLRTISASKRAKLSLWMGRTAAATCSCGMRSKALVPARLSSTAT